MAMWKNKSGRVGNDKTRHTMYLSNDQVTDTQYQDVCISYMYGIDIEMATEWRESGDLMEDAIARACDCFNIRGLPLDVRDKCEACLQAERQQIQKEYGLSPIAAIVKRDELHLKK